jgi:glycosyltransferase involved in cell wall biosynthesis
MRNNFNAGSHNNYTSLWKTVVNNAPVTEPVKLPRILFIASYPPRECGIATYTQDLIKALHQQFSNSFDISICALGNQNEQHTYPDEVDYILETDKSRSYRELAEKINNNRDIKMVLIQHEFGLFHTNEADFRVFLQKIIKPVTLVFHTVLPRPNENLRHNVQLLSQSVEGLIVMTQNSAKILDRDYGISGDKVSVIGHGTHLVEHLDKNVLKAKYGLSGKKVLSTFGLLSSGKSIETTLYALPEIVKENPETVFLIIGKTHPGVVKNEGEAYRNQLIDTIEELGLQNNVQFINRFLTLDELLEYLQMTDVYLFTSKDPNQAVSGTFSYALSCGCPIISTPIPHAMEVLSNDTGTIFDFGDSNGLAKEVNLLLANEALRNEKSINGLHKIVPNSWENSALAHAIHFNKITDNHLNLQYKIPEINLKHVKNMTTDFGMYQFSVVNHPDPASGYTLDDNARALITMCKHYEKTRDDSDLKLIETYLNFIEFCLRPDGYFLNYVDIDKQFTEQNHQTNLADSNGRAIWALGYLISKGYVMPVELTMKAELLMRKALKNADKVYSTRAMAFTIKGLYYKNLKKPSEQDVELMRLLANRMVQMYRHEAKEGWEWFENYLTYANSLLPEAMLMAYLGTGDSVYQSVAKNSFDFLLSKTFRDGQIRVISNKGWMHVGDKIVPGNLGGEQPIDVAYTILALGKFYDVFKDETYLKRMETAFNWFLGNNYLNQIIYNPCTGGCFDGLEDTHVNLNQGAESTLSYLIARLFVDKYLVSQQPVLPKVSGIKMNYLRQNHHFQLRTL